MMLMGNKPVFHGIAASLLLLALYFGIVGILQGFDYAISRFAELWYFMVPLVAGFGFQIGLFSYIRNYAKAGSNVAAASGGTSTVSMIACCAHHITDVIPILGVSALGVFLLEYQPAFLVIGLVSNLIGILFMLNIAKKNRIKFKNGFLDGATKYDLGKILKIATIAGIAVIILAFLTVKPVALSGGTSGVDLKPLTDEQNSVTVVVKPLEFNAGNPVKFDISMDTHSVALDFDLKQISTLVADGKEIKPTNWESSGSGGHHVSGTLTFEPVGKVPQNLKLVIKNIAGADRVFEWTLAVR